MVWKCFDEDGNCSTPFISDKTITGKIYLNECMKRRLLPFIKKYHNIDDVIL